MTRLEDSDETFHERRSSPPLVIQLAIPVVSAAILAVSAAWVSTWNGHQRLVDHVQSLGEQHAREIADLEQELQKLHNRTESNRQRWATCLERLVASEQIVRFLSDDFNSKRQHSRNGS